MEYKKIVEVQIDDKQRRAISFVRDLLENIIFALGVKVLILILSAIGITNMWYRMKYKELCDAAYILTKIVGVKPWEQI